MKKELDNVKKKSNISNTGFLFCLGIASFLQKSHVYYELCSHIYYKPYKEDENTMMLSTKPR